jgi:hypothetical protein
MSRRCFNEHGRQYSFNYLTAMEARLLHVVCPIVIIRILTESILAVFDVSFSRPEHQVETNKFLFTFLRKLINLKSVKSICIALH